MGIARQLKQKHIQPGGQTGDAGGIQVYNDSGVAITAGMLVVLTGLQGDYTPEVSAADADSNALAYSKVWVAPKAIPTAAYGRAVPWHIVTGAVTTGSTIGDPVFLSATAGGWTLTPTTARAVVVGRVMKVHASAGVVLLDPQSAAEDPLARRAVAHTFFTDFLGGTLPPGLASDLQTANITLAGLSSVAGGVFRFLTDSTSEAQAGQITFGDVLSIDLANGPILEARIRIAPAGATLTADERIVLGFVSAHATAETALDGTTHNAWFRTEGANLDLLWETDDNSTDDDDNDTGINYVKSAWTVFRIDFSTPTAPTFYVDGVLATGTAAMAAASYWVQPILCIQRDAGTEANSLDIDYLYIREPA